MGDEAIRERILAAAFAAFTKGGFAATSTAEIAARAHVSKRELYALVGDKQAMLTACISARARRLHMPAELPVVRDRSTLEQVLVSYGAQLVREVSEPTVIAAFRLAIAEAPRAPEVAETLDSIARETRRVALQSIMAQAKKLGLLKGSPPDLARLFAALLFGDLHVSLLLGVAKPPSPREIEKRAHDATTAFLRLSASR
ncbi:MAG: TetR/AcrR family transcriptional regulator [Candidatus Aquilonibacter sp.]